MNITNTPFHQNKLSAYYADHFSFVTYLGSVEHEGDKNKWDLYLTHIKENIDYPFDVIARWGSHEGDFNLGMNTIMSDPIMNLAVRLAVENQHLTLEELEFLNKKFDTIYELIMWRDSTIFGTWVEQYEKEGIEFFDYRSKEHFVNFKVEYKARIKVSPFRSLEEVLEDIDIPENDQCKYISDSFELRD